MVFLLLHCNKICIFFIILLLFILILLDRIKEYNEFNIADQILQENLGFIYKMNNVFVIIIILAIIIGSLSSLDVVSLLKSITQHDRKCV